jgi:type VI secretion system secreted protein VgrG
MRQDGLFCWWEHGPEATTLVIADHNGAFTLNPQPRARFTGSGLSLAEDSLTEWRSTAAAHSARIAQASQDYRANGAEPALRALQQTTTRAPAGLQNLSLTDTPGPYAWADAPQAQRLLNGQLQALDAQRHQASARGTLRCAAAGSTVTLADHPLHDGLDPQRDDFVILGVHHRARNNLRADLKAQVHSLAQAIRIDAQDRPSTETLPNESDEPVYSSTLLLLLQPAVLPLRMAGRLG